MNIAIEYMLRNQKIEKLLNFPCSLFLESTSCVPKKLIVTLFRCYGPDFIIARKYSPLETAKTDVLPPYQETKLKLSEIFSHPDVVVPKYKIREFREEPYETPEKQYAELPQAPIQERDHKDVIENFFYPRTVRSDREHWLWNSFYHIYSCLAKVNVGEISHLSHLTQMEYVNHYDKTRWRIWEHWRRNLLDFPGPATELVFARAYKSHFLTPKVSGNEYGPKSAFFYSYIGATGTATPRTATANTATVPNYGTIATYGTITAKTMENFGYRS